LLDDTVNKAYSGWPDRLYLVGKDGQVAYKGGPGPSGFKPLELELAIQKALQR
jgi:type I thyroxine 5'-deiodinase